jgi:hypothetical protein
VAETKGTDTLCTRLLMTADDLEAEFQTKRPAIVTAEAALMRDAAHEIIRQRAEIHNLRIALSRIQGLAKEAQHG